MNRKSLIILLLVVTVLLAVLSWALRTVTVQYTWVIKPLALLISFIFGVRVAANYSRDLKKSFLFLSIFLLLYAPMNIPQQYLWRPLLDAAGSTSYLIIINILQAATYAMLITSCIYTLRVIEVKRVNRIGWIAMAAVLVLCVVIVAKGLPDFQSVYQTSQVDAISNLIIRVFDMAIIFMLFPVLLLRLQYSQAKTQESITFTMIMGGVIVSLLSTYIFELFGVSLSDVGNQWAQNGWAWLDVIYIFGYSLIGAGLYANMMYDAWGFRDIERALS
jgi:hypothetical protein